MTRPRRCDDHPIPQARTRRGRASLAPRPEFLEDRLAPSDMLGGLLGRSWSGGAAMAPPAQLTGPVVAGATQGAYPEVAEVWAPQEPGRTPGDHGPIPDRQGDIRSPRVDPPSYDPSRILVRFRPEVANSNVRAPLGGTWTGPKFSLIPGLEMVHLPEGLGVEDALAAYRADPRVLYAEPDYYIQAHRFPNDPLFPSNDGLNNTGQGGGTPGADIVAPEAWDITTGSVGTIVAMIDTGVDYNHPDLAANMWVNEGEIPGNGLDDDDNGYIDDVHGYDFVNDDGDPMDDQGHGTLGAGILGAVGDNGIGVTGVNWGVRIMALKFMDANFNGTVSRAIQALNYAVANGATISNNSYSSVLTAFGYSQAHYEAIQNARDAGHIYVASAGNTGSDNDSSPRYPPSYPLDNIVAVAATDANDQLADFSSYGAGSVHLAAPGVHIPTTELGGGYSLISGTSASTPFVTGVLALVRGQHPDWTYNQVIDRVLNTVDVVPSLQGVTVTGGRLNAARAVAPGDGCGSGLQGEYFDALGFAGPATTRVDAAVDFGWGQGVPAAGLGPDTFSVRWTGQVVPEFSETYTFATASDDGVRLWDDGRLRKGFRVGWRSG